MLGRMTAAQFHGSIMPPDMPPRSYLFTNTSDFDFIETPVNVLNVLQNSFENASSVLMSGNAIKCDLISSHR